MKRKALGRGLSALLSDAPIEAVDTLEKRQIEDISVNAIDVNHYQPRAAFDDDSMNELAHSISTQGVLQPLLVRRDPAQIDRYQLIAGERRLRASRMANRESVPCIVIEAEEADMLEIALIENVQRANLNPVEEARAYKHLIDRFQLTQEEVAEKVGKRRETISNALRLLNLPELVLTELELGEISTGHAKALLGVQDPYQIVDILTQIKDSHWSVRQTESYIRQLNQPQEEKPAKPEPAAETEEDVHIRDLRRALETNFQTKVDIKMKGKEKGKLEIHFYDLDQLDSLLQRWKIRL